MGGCVSHSIWHTCGGQRTCLWCHFSSSVFPRVSAVLFVSMVASDCKPLHRLTNPTCPKKPIPKHLRVKYANLQTIKPHLNLFNFITNAPPVDTTLLITYGRVKNEANKLHIMFT